MKNLGEKLERAEYHEMVERERLTGKRKWQVMYLMKMRLGI